MPFVGSQPFERIRRSGGARGSDGRPAAPTEDTSTQTGTINPVPGEELALLPEGERRGENVRIICRIGTLRGADDTSGTLSDLVVWDGKTFEVRTVQTYRRVIAHDEVRVKRIEGG